jgi:hypothetical protein
LGGEISDDVGQVTSVEGSDTFFLEDSGETVGDTGVSGDFSGLDLGVGVLGLQQQFHSLDGGNGGFGHSGGDTTGKEVNSEAFFLRLLGGHNMIYQIFYKLAKKS